MSEYTVREQKLRRMKALRRRQVRRQKILLGCMTGILVCAAAGVLLYSRSYTLDLKTRLIPETTVREAKPLLGGKMEQALAETTQLAVKNSGTKVIAHRGYSSEAPENTLPAWMNWQRRAGCGGLRLTSTKQQMEPLSACTIQQWTG